MPGVWIHSAAGLVLKGHLHLMCAALRDNITGKQRTIALDDCRILILVFHMYRDTIEVIAVLLKDEILSTFTCHSIDGQDDLFRPFLNRNA